MDVFDESFILKYWKIAYSSRTLQDLEYDLGHVFGAIPSFVSRSGGHVFGAIPSFVNISCISDQAFNFSFFNNEQKIRLNIYSHCT